MLWEAVVIIVLLILIYYLYYDTLAFGPYNTKTVELGNEKYQVHRAHSDTKAAAALLAEINRRNETLISHLREKYTNTSPKISFDPTKNNRIDIIPGTGMYESLGGDIVELLNNPVHKEYLQERINQLVKNYSPSRIYEISPLNTGDATSYTEDKKILVLCLRHKKANASGQHELHDINTMMFVVIHELSHMMNNEWNHGLDFWVLFKFLLLNAVEAGIYTPVNYEIHPINYCGLWLRYNPLFDSKI
jgi:hypothetical protein